MNDLSEYRKLRHLIKTGDIIEFASNSIIGKLIRAKTKQVVNHTAIALWMQPISSYMERDRAYNPEVRLYIGEAIANGFHLTYLSKVLENYDGHVNWSQLKEWNEKKRNEIAAHAFELEGRPYDYVSLFRNLIERVPVNADKPYCSESYQIALINSGILGQYYSPTGKNKDKGCGIVPGEFQYTGLFEKPIWLI